MLDISKNQGLSSIFAENSEDTSIAQKLVKQFNEGSNDNLVGTP